MNETTLEIIDGKLMHNGKEYDCSMLVERDKKTILREADESHEGVIDRLYVRESLRPAFALAVTDKDDNIVYINIIYHIDYKDCKAVRMACGDYYPFAVINGNKLFHRPYQGSICW